MIPAVAPIASSASHDDASTCVATLRPSIPARVSGTDVTSPSDEAVTATTAEPMRYA